MRIQILPMRETKVTGVKVQPPLKKMELAGPIGLNTDASIDPFWVFLAEVSVQELTVQEVSVQELTVQEVAVQEVTVQEVSVQEVSVQEVSVQEVTVQEVAVQEVTVQEVAGHRRSYVWCCLIGGLGD